MRNRSTFFCAVGFVQVIVVCSMLSIAPIPVQAADENTDQPYIIMTEHEKQWIGDWQFHGLTGTAKWNNNVQADLLLVHPLGGDCIDIKRTDRRAGTIILTAIYHSCTITGLHIDGQATFTFSNNPNPVQIPFSADFQVITPASAYDHGMTALKTHDQAGARKWLEWSATQGNKDARIPLAALMRDGIGGPKDLSGARKMFAAAASDGDAGAQYALARMEEDGIGAPSDLAAARKLYEQAATQHFAAAFDRLTFIDGLDYTPPLNIPNPAWHQDDKTLRDNYTVVHSLFTHLESGGETYALVIECWTKGISAAGLIGMALWEMPDPANPTILTGLKYRRQDVDSDAGSPPLSERFRPNRWSIVTMPGDTPSARGRLANQEQWRLTINQITGYGINAFTRPENVDAAAARHMYDLYNIIFRQPPPGSAPDYRDILEVEAGEAPAMSPGGGSSIHRVLNFDMNGLDDARHDFLERKCAMADPFADPAVRNEQPDK